MKLFVLIVLLILLEIRTKPEFFLENDKNQLLSFKFLTKSTKWLFILYSNYNCIDCVLKLDHFVNSLKDTNIKKGVIIRCDNNIMIKKELLNKIKKLLPGYYVFFDIHKSEDPWPPCNLKDGIFGYFKVCQTPSLLFADDKRIKFLSNGFLFGENFSIEKQLENEILDFFYKNK
jgi:hypothetical protein